MSRLEARPEARRRAIEATSKHIIDVGKGRVRLGFTPDEVDEYQADEVRRLQKLKALGLRV